MNLIDQKRIFLEIKFFFKFRKKFKALLRAKSQKTSQCCYIFLHSGESFYTLKLMALFCLPLINHDMNIVFISPEKKILRRFKILLGIKLLNLNIIFLSNQNFKYCNEIITRFEGALNRCNSDSDFLNFDFEGINFGKYALAKVLRDQKITSINNDPHLMKLIKLECLECFNFLKSLQSNLRFNVVTKAVFIEAHYSPFGPLVQFLIQNTNVDTIQITQSWREDALTLRRLTKETHNWHPSRVPDQLMHDFTTEKFSADHEALLNNILRKRYRGDWSLQSRNVPADRRMSVEEVREVFALDETKPTAVIYCHVLWDANYFYGDDLYPSISDWLINTVKIAHKNKNINWLIKIHPANVWKSSGDYMSKHSIEKSMLEQRFGRLPGHIKFIEANANINTFDLFLASEIAITVRGTAGIEFASLGKKVILAGTGRYSGYGFTQEFRCQQDYESYLLTLHQNSLKLSKEATSLAKYHALVAFEYCIWKLESFKFRTFLSGRVNDLFYDGNPDASLDQLKDFAELSDWQFSDEIHFINKKDL